LPRNDVAWEVWLDPNVRTGRDTPIRNLPEDHMLICRGGFSRRNHGTREFTATYIIIRRDGTRSTFTLRPFQQATDFGCQVEVVVHRHGDARDPEDILGSVTIGP
jgi:hypothetical protein